MAVEDTTAFPSFREQILRPLALFALLVTCGLVLAGTARAEIEAPPPPQVWSDKADYAPGELVTLSGANWAPGESVHVRVNDDAGESWSRDVDVTADANGGFSDQFNLPDWFVAVYSVTATGASSGTATWSFTDGNVTVHLDAAEGVSSMTVTYDRWNGSNANPNSTCSGAPTLVNQTLVVASGGTANIPGFGGNNDSVRFKSVSTPTAGKAFDRWTSGDNKTDSGTTLAGSPTPCISNGGSGTNGNVTDAYGHFKNANTAPVCSNGSATTDEDTAVAASLNCSDAESNSLTYTIVSGPAHGDLSGTAPNLTYTPDDDFNGSDSFTFKASDGSLQSNVATFSLTVNAVNDAPTCSNGSASTDEDTPVAASVSCADVDSSSLTYEVVSGPAQGDLSGTAPNFTYTPDDDFNGSDSFTFKASDGSLESNVAAFSLTVNAVNDAPTCSNGSASTDEDTAVAASVSCADVDSASLTYTVVSGPAHGALSGTAPNFTYTPDEDYNGSDSFTFKASDGSLQSDVATFSLTVNPVDDPPTVTRDDASVTVDEGDTATNSGTYGDVDGDTVTLSASVGTVTKNPDGTWDWSFGTSDGPDQSQTVTVTASDGSAGDDASVTFALVVDNVAPVVTAAAAQSSDEGDSHSFALGSFTDPGADGPWSVDVDWGDGSPHTSFSAAGPGSLGSKSHTYADGPNDYTVTVTVSEAGSDPTPSDSDSFDVHVNNVAPKLAWTANPNPVDESTVAERTYSFSISDPGDDDAGFVSGYPTCGANGELVAGSASINGSSTAGSFKCVFDDGTAFSDVAVKVNDGDDNSSELSEHVEIRNVAPSVEFTTAPTTAEEGDTKTYQYTYSDPGADTISFASGYPTCGDDGSVVGSPAIANPGSFQCLFPEGPNTTNVAIRVSDGEASSADVLTVNIVAVTIANVPPDVQLDGPASANEGDKKSYSYSWTDPSATDTFTAEVSCGPKGVVSGEAFSSSSKTGSFDCTFGDDSGGGTFEVKATVTDDDGGAGHDSVNVDVDNVDPTASNPGFTFDPVLGTATASFHFADVGWLDTHQASFFTWSAGVAGVKTVTEENDRPDATGTASETRTFAPGCYSLTVTGTAKDDDNGMSAPLSIHSDASTGVFANGFRPPIIDNERNIAKYGNVVPVKVMLTNPCTGGSVTNVALYVQLVKGVNGEYIEANNVVTTSVSAADTGQQMRVADGMYIYNLATKNLTANSDYAVQIRLGSPSGPKILQAVLQPKK